jgi:hypothetical protein
MHIRSISALALSIAFALPGFAEQTYRFTKLPTKTFRQLAEVPAPPPLPRENRHEARRPHTSAVGNARVLRIDSAEAQPTLTTTATIAPPPIAVGFPSDTSKVLSPADVGGAANKTHVVAVSNAGIVLHSRAGAIQSEVTLSQFWANRNSVAEFYDPRMTYDASQGRWVTSAIQNEAKLLLAVSATSDPTSTWYRYEVAIDGCDFTRLAITRKTVMLYTFIPDEGRSILFSFDKSQLYAGTGNLVVRRHDLAGQEAVPVNAPDSDAEYIVEAGTSDLFFRRIDQPSSGWKAVDSGFHWEYPFGEYAPQLGTSVSLDMGYGDVESAIYRGGFLYAVHRIGAGNRTPDGNALLWWKVDPSGKKPAELGLIDGNGRHYAYPSMAVNASGAMLISYCVFSASTYPSAEYIYRDPLGRVSTSAVVQPGDSSTTVTDRWGDYTTVVTDTNDRDFWIGQIRTAGNHWESWWANVKVPAGRARAVRK